MYMEKNEETQVQKLGTLLLGSQGGRKGLGLGI